jgi:hypothetical protein
MYRVTHRYIFPFREYFSPHISLSIYLWLYCPFVGPGRFFSFLAVYTVGVAPWTGDDPVARPLPTHRSTQTE